jgi:putative membrane protein
LSRADLRSVGEVLGRLGWLAPVILVPYVLVYVVDCLGWRFSFPPGMKIHFATLFRIRWAGESVNNVLPSAYVGGEAVKVYLLRKHGVAAETGMSSAVVSKSAQSVAQLLFILLAAIAFLQLAGDQPGLRAGMTLVLGAGVLVLAGLFWVQRRGLFGSLLAIASALHLKFGFLEKHRAKILEVDQIITGFYRNHRARFCASTGIYLGGWLLDTLEIYFVAHLLGMPISWPQALAVEAFTSVAKVLGMWVPGALGVQESSIVMLGRLAGLPDPLSVTYALLRRVREILFAMVGWLFLYSQETPLRTLRAGVVPAAPGLNLKNNPKP